jgi:hypothetical protein
MLYISEGDVTFLLKVLLEHIEKIERMQAYPEQKNDLKPYNDLVHRLVEYRDKTLLKGSRKTKRAKPDQTLRTH